jgi:hypothetical protein
MATKTRAEHRKYPKIPLGKPLTAREILAGYKITPLEMRRAKRAVELATRERAAKKISSKTAKSSSAAK